MPLVPGPHFEEHDIKTPQVSPMCSHTSRESLPVLESPTTHQGSQGNTNLFFYWSKPNVVREERVLIAFPKHAFLSKEISVV